MGREQLEGRAAAGDLGWAHRVGSIRCQWGRCEALGCGVRCGLQCLETMSWSGE